MTPSATDVTVIVMGAGMDDDILDDMGEVEEARKEVMEISEELRRALLKLEEPAVQATLMYKLVGEKRKMNKLLEDIHGQLRKLEKLELRVARIEAKIGGAVVDKPILTEAEERMLDFIRKMDKVCAEDIQRRFGYRGKNGASARLNRLYDMGMLERKQVGRKVFYIYRDEDARRFNLNEMVKA